MRVMVKMKLLFLIIVGNICLFVRYNVLIDFIKFVCWIICKNLFFNVVIFEIFVFEF